VYKGGLMAYGTGINPTSTNFSTWNSMIWTISATGWPTLKPVTGCPL